MHRRYARPFSSRISAKLLIEFRVATPCKKPSSAVIIITLTAVTRGQIPFFARKSRTATIFGVVADRKTDFSQFNFTLEGGILPSYAWAYEDFERRLRIYELLIIELQIDDVVETWRILKAIDCNFLNFSGQKEKCIIRVSIHCLIHLFYRNRAIC